MNKNGFTLIETLIAISILLIAMVGPFQVIQQGLLASYAARDELIAASLAEEGLEFVRARRDGNYLYNLNNPSSPRPWLYGMDGTSGPDCYSGNGCTVDPSQNAVALFATSTAPLKLSTANIYTQTNPAGAVTTRFMRKIQFTDVSPTEVMVTVTVLWSTNRIPFTVKITNTLHDWL